MTYQDRLRVMEAARPETRYITKAEYSAQKARLTRAVNSDSPRAVLAAVEKTLDEWSGKAWPDDWARWRRALEDAANDARQQGFSDLSRELNAAALVLFR